MRGKVCKFIRREIFNNTKPKDMDARTRNLYRETKRLYKITLDKTKNKMV